jgi:hypothetical protein
MLYSIVQYVRIRMPKRTILLKKPNKILRLCSDVISIISHVASVPKFTEEFHNKTPKRENKHYN